MRTRSKVGIGCLAVLLLLVIAGVVIWLTAPEPPAIAVDEPGDGGVRITLNEKPANFFAGQGDGPRPAIIMLGGSEGGLRESQNALARQLAAEGYSVLYPGYYRTSEETKTFNMVPLETFDAAVEWLQTRDDIDGNRLAMMGVSKGAEGVLLYASRTPSIRAVVAVAPSNVVWQGFDWTAFDMSQFSSSWSVDGEPIPYVPYATLEFSEWFDGGGVGKMYSKSLDEASAHTDGFIKIEAIAGPVLLLCGEQDSLWPSCRMSRLLVERANEFGKDDVEVLAYPDGGHAIYGEPVDEDAERFERLGSMGGTPEGNNEGRRDGWRRTLEFLDAALMPQAETTENSGA